MFPIARWTLCRIADPCTELRDKIIAGQYSGSPGLGSCDMCHGSWLNLYVLGFSLGRLDIDKLSRSRVNSVRDSVSPYVNVVKNVKWWRSNCITASWVLYIFSIMWFVELQRCSILRYEDLNVFIVSQVIKIYTVQFLLDLIVCIVGNVHPRAQNRSASTVTARTCAETTALPASQDGRGPEERLAETQQSVTWVVQLRPKHPSWDGRTAWQRSRLPGLVGSRGSCTRSFLIRRTPAMLRTRLLLRPIKMLWRQFLKGTSSAATWMGIQYFCLFVLKYMQRIEDKNAKGVVIRCSQIASHLAISNHDPLFISKAGVRNLRLWKRPERCTNWINLITWVLTFESCYQKAIGFIFSFMGEEL